MTETMIAKPLNNSHFHVKLSQSGMKKVFVDKFRRQTLFSKSLKVIGLVHPSYQIVSSELADSNSQPNHTTFNRQKVLF